jgi:flagellar assembly factor FliW
MPVIKIQGTEIEFEDKDVINFAEGLVGFPQLKRMVIVRQDSIEPFMWLASLDHDELAFVVVETGALFGSSTPTLPADANLASLIGVDEKPVTLAIVLIDSDWQKCTVNLRAPIFVSAQAMAGAQIILNDERYSVRAPLPLAMAA